MRESSGWWDEELRRRFKKSVTDLKKTTKNPSPEKDYRESIHDALPSQPELYALSSKHELQIADDLAYLCCWKDDVKCISAVTLKECKERLVVVLASNETPPSKLKEQLEDILKTVHAYMVDKDGRRHLRKMLFDQVLKLSKNRIRNLIRDVPLTQKLKEISTKLNKKLNDTNNPDLEQFVIKLGIVTDSLKRID
ncbi:hypothetical protein B0T10DRAFT_524233, partial [Thelonectria olida]